MSLLVIAQTNGLEKRQIRLMALLHLLDRNTGLWLAKWPRFLGLAGTILFLLAAATYGKMLSDGPHFADNVLAFFGLQLAKVRIDGLKELHAEQVMAALDIRPGRALVLYDHEAARRRLAALGWVKNVSVARLHPGVLHVDIEERRPLARWYRDGRLDLIDTQGAVIDAPPGPHSHTLPLIIGQGANAHAGSVLSALAIMQDRIPKLRALHLVSGRRWDVLLENGVKILLPEENFDAALLQLADLHARGNLLHRAIARVDLRLDDRVVVRLSDDAALARRLAFGIVPAETAADEESDAISDGENNTHDAPGRGAQARRTHEAGA